METVTFTVSAVWNTAFAIAFNDYLRLLKKTNRRPWHGDGVEGSADTNCYLYVVIKFENTLKEWSFPFAWSEPYKFFSFNFFSLVV